MLESEIRILGKTAPGRDQNDGCLAAKVHQASFHVDDGKRIT